MSPVPERRRAARWIAYAAFTSVVALATVPIYLGAAPRYRQTVVRLSGALIAAVLLLRLRTTCRDHIGAGVSSALDAARRPRRPPESHDPSFLALRDEVRFSTASQRYFEQALWPRFLALRAEAPTGASAELRRPPGRRLFRRGPTLGALADVVAAFERRP